MSHKLDYFKHMEYIKEIYLYLIGLTNVGFDVSSKGDVIGYKVDVQNFKFVTLIAESYQSLVLHVEPRNRNTL